MTLDPLPLQWESCLIADICDLVNGRAFKPSEWTSLGLPIVRIQNLNDETAGYNYCNFEVDQKVIIENGELLFAWSGTPDTSFGAHIWKGGRAVLNQHIFKVSVDETCVNKRFVMYAFNNNVRDFIAKAHGTAGLAHITKGKFESSPFLLPPLSEQHRIVAKIEELFSYLDAGVEALKKVKAELKRYRQAVLKAAVEGKLTEEWRANNRGKLEPASVLLERIRAELAKNGKAKKLQPIDTSELPGLPEGWEWTEVCEVSEKIQYGTSEKATEDPTHGLPVVRMGNIQDGEIDFGKLKYLAMDLQDLKDFILEAGDVLFNRTNSIELVGKTAVFKSHYPKAVFASYLIRVKMKRQVYNPYLLSFYINSSYGRQYIARVVSQQVGQANVNGTKLSHMVIPFPPQSEQQQIVSQVEQRLSVADEVEKTVEAGLKEAGRLRQSILKRAFEGKLVPQDQSDEPAEKLLERIRAAHGNSAPVRRTKRKRRKS